MKHRLEFGVVGVVGVKHRLEFGVVGVVGVVGMVGVVGVVGVVDCGRHGNVHTMFQKGKRLAT